MEKYTFTIPNISCGHCVMAIKNELTEIEGIINVDGDPDLKTVTVEWEVPVTRDLIIETLKEINYPASS
ncbi:MAG: heavy-metal-associated domain-containing protein [Desulfobacterales bacterium]|nr:heavy-metal-associated domain-containing protein [Desulfobacterales bacterium]